MSGFDRFLDAAAHDFVQAQRAPEARAHLTQEVLSEYRSRRVRGAERDRIQDHLVACRECADLLLRLIAANPALPWWRRIGSYFAGIARQPVPAVLVLAVIPLGAWTIFLERANRQLSAPQIQTPVVELFAGPTRGRPEAAKEIPLRSGTGIFTLVLHVPDPAPPTFDLELVHPDGGVLWRTGDVRPDADGSVTLSIPQPAMGGARELRIRLLESGRRSIVAVYAIHLTAP